MEKQMPDLKVLCFTIEEFTEAQKIAFAWGKKWGGENTEIKNTEDGLPYVKDTALFIEGNRLLYGPYTDRPEYPLFSFKEFRNKYGTQDMKKVVEKMKTEKPEKVNKKQVEVEVYRKQGKTFFKFSVDEHLEKIFKEQSGGEKKKSESWKGLEFYYYPKVVDSPEYRRLLERYNLFDDFGHSFMRNNNSLNIAFLRTVGGKGEIEVKNDIPFAVITHGLRNMTQFIKEFYEEFLSDYKVKAIVNVEL